MIFSRGSCRFEIQDVMCDPPIHHTKAYTLDKMGENGKSHDTKKYRTSFNHYFQEHNSKVKRCSCASNVTLPTSLEYTKHSTSTIPHVFVSIWNWHMTQIHGKWYMDSVYNHWIVCKWYMESVTTTIHRYKEATLNTDKRNHTQPERVWSYHR